MTKFGPARGGEKNGDNGATGAWQMGQNHLHSGQGVPALVCRRAFPRFKESMPVWTLFLLGVLRDFSERSRADRELFPGASATSGGFRKGGLSEAPGVVCRVYVSRVRTWGRPLGGGAPRDRHAPRVHGAAHIALDAARKRRAALP